MSRGWIPESRRGVWAVVVPALAFTCACGRGDITLGEYALVSAAGASGGGVAGVAGQAAGGSTPPGTGGTESAGVAGSSGAPASAGTSDPGGAGFGGAPDVSPEGGRAGAGYIWICNSGFCGPYACAIVRECDAPDNSDGAVGTVCQRNSVDCSDGEVSVSCERRANEECPEGLLKPWWWVP